MSGPMHWTPLLSRRHLRLADIWNQVIGPGDNEARRGVSDTSASDRAVDSPAPWLGGLMFVSLLVMLNLPLFFTAITGMDLYGLFTLEPIAAPPWPLALSTVLSSSMAFAGLTCYRWLWRRQEWFTGGRWGPFTRGVVLSSVPVALAYAPSVVLTSHGGKPGLIAVAGLMAGSLCVTHALRDAGAKLDPTLARDICSLAQLPPSWCSSCSPSEGCWCCIRPSSCRHRAISCGIGNTSGRTWGTRERSSTKGSATPW